MLHKQLRTKLRKATSVTGAKLDMGKNEKMLETRDEYNVEVLDCRNDAPRGADKGIQPTTNETRQTQPHRENALQGEIIASEAYQVIRHGGSGRERGNGTGSQGRSRHESTNVTT